MKTQKKEYKIVWRRNRSKKENQEKAKKSSIHQTQNVNRLNLLFRLFPNKEEKGESCLILLLIVTRVKNGSDSFYVSNELEKRFPLNKQCQNELSLFSSTFPSLLSSTFVLPNKRREFIHIY